MQFPAKARDAAREAAPEWRRPRRRWKHRERRDRRADCAAAPESWCLRRRVKRRRRRQKDARQTEIEDQAVIAGNLPALAHEERGADRGRVRREKRESAPNFSATTMTQKRMTRENEALQTSSRPKVSGRINRSPRRRCGIREHGRVLVRQKLPDEAGGRDPRWRRTSAGPGD